MRSRTSNLICALVLLAEADASAASSKYGVTDFGVGGSSLQINNSDQVAGLDRTQAGFLYSGGKFTTLTPDIQPVALSDSGTVIDGRGPFDWYADKINDSGQIIAYGHGADGVEHGYLLSPSDATTTPEPSTLALLGLAAAGYGVRRLRNTKV